MGRESASALMVLPDAFHLGWLGATHRVFHIARSLRKIGLRVVLLSGRPTNRLVQNELDRAFPGTVIRTRHSGDYPRVVDWNGVLRRTWRAAWKLHGEDVYFSKLSWGWAERLSISDVRLALEKEGVWPKVVWGVSAGYLEGAVAAERIARVLGVPWVFELHDPPRGAGIGARHDIVERQFASLVRSSTRILVTADTYRDELLELYRVEDSKIHVAHLTYDEVVSEQSEDDRNRFTLVYAGSLQGGRSLRPFLLALEDAFVEYPEMRASVRVRLAGVGRGFHEADQVSRELGIRHSVDFLGTLTGEEVVRVLGCSDTVLIVQPDVSYHQVPGKIFESLALRKPILGIMPAGCEAAHILRESGLGLVCEATDHEGIRETLVTLWLAWRRGESIVVPNEPFIKRFSVESLAGKLARVLEGVVALGPSTGSDGTVLRERQALG